MVKDLVESLADRPDFLVTVHSSRCPGERVPRRTSLRHVASLPAHRTISMLASRLGGAVWPAQSRSLGFTRVIVRLLTALGASASGATPPAGECFPRHPAGSEEHRARFTHARRSPCVMKR